MYFHLGFFVAGHRPIAALVLRDLAKFHRADLAAAFAFTVAMKIVHAGGAAPRVCARGTAENHGGAQSDQRCE